MTAARVTVHANKRQRALRDLIVTVVALHGGPGLSLVHEIVRKEEVEGVGAHEVDGAYQLMVLLH